MLSASMLIHSAAPRSMQTCARPCLHFYCNPVLSHYASARALLQPLLYRHAVLVVAPALDTRGVPQQSRVATNHT